MACGASGVPSHSALLLAVAELRSAPEVASKLTRTGWIALDLILIVSLVARIPVQVKNNVLPKSGMAK